MCRPTSNLCGAGYPSSISLTRRSVCPPTPTTINHVGPSYIHCLMPLRLATLRRVSPAACFAASWRASRRGALLLLGGWRFMAKTVRTHVLTTPHFKPGDPAPKGYVQWHEWADAQYEGGLRQTQCPICNLWRFPQELSTREHKWVGRKRGRKVNLSAFVCLKCTVA